MLEKRKGVAIERVFVLTLLFTSYDSKRPNLGKKIWRDWFAGFSQTMILASPATHEVVGRGENTKKEGDMKQVAMVSCLLADVFVEKKRQREKKREARRPGSLT